MKYQEVIIAVLFCFTTCFTVVQMRGCVEATNSDRRSAWQACDNLTQRFANR